MEFGLTCVSKSCQVMLGTCISSFGALLGFLGLLGFRAGAGAAQGLIRMWCVGLRNWVSCFGTASFLAFGAVGAQGIFRHGLAQGANYNRLAFGVARHHFFQARNLDEHIVLLL